MKKKFYIISMLLITLFLASCGGDDNDIAASQVIEVDFQEFVQTIYSSEELLAGYNESYAIYDGDTIVHSYDKILTIERGETINTEVTETTKKLSLNGNGLEESVVSYYTIGDKKYNSNGTSTTYKVPTYFLTFVMSEEFLIDGFKFYRVEGGYVLSADVKSNYMSSLFINKSLEGLVALSLNIKIVDSKLNNFEANYTFTNQFTAKTTIEYNYQN